LKKIELLKDFKYELVNEDGVFEGKIGDDGVEFEYRVKVAKHFRY
jgi:hypothetical protein